MSFSIFALFCLSLYIIHSQITNTHIREQSEQQVVEWSVLNKDLLSEPNILNCNILCCADLIVRLYHLRRQKYAQNYFKIQKNHYLICFISDKKEKYKYSKVKPLNTNTIIQNPGIPKMNEALNLFNFENHKLVHCIILSYSIDMNCVKTNVQKH